MTKLTDTQLVVLGAASMRDDGSLLPLPKSLKGGAADKVIAALIRKGLAERIVDDRPAIDDLVRITRAGLRAINADPDEDDDEAETAPDTPNDKTAAVAAAGPEAPATSADGAKTAATKSRKTRAGTKQAALIAMLRRTEGATIDEIRRETGWLAHTVRGVLSGALKKKLGLAIVSEKVKGRGRTYRIIDAA